MTQSLLNLHAWMQGHEHLLDRHPFSEVEELVERVLEDGVISSNEHAELLWMCERLTLPNAAFDALSDEIHKLHGYLQGVAADGVVNAAEIDRLRHWCMAHEQFSAVWPFDVTMTLLDQVLKDGRIDADEHQELLAFCAEFGSPTRSLTQVTPSFGSTVHSTSNICAVDPSIVFKGMRFCFAGKCSEGNREEMTLKVTHRGGEVTESVGKHLNYLVIGGKANPCWSYSVFGLRIEQALHHKIAGAPLSIVTEVSFMAAVRANKLASA